MELTHSETESEFETTWEIAALLLSDIESRYRSFGMMRTMLTGFEQSDFYRADVAPLVVQAQRGRYRYLGRDYGLQGAGYAEKP